MAESGNMFFDQYNKVFPEMQEKVIPLAMQKMKMDMEAERFNMALEAARAEQANKIAEEEFIKNNPITSRKDLIRLLPFAKDKAGFAEKVLQDEKPTFYTIGEGQKLVSGEGNLIAEGNPKTKTPNIKSVDLGDRVDVYKDGVYAGTFRKGLSPAGANASGNREDSAKQKEVNKVLQALDDFDKRYYSNLEPTDTFNQNEKLKLNVLRNKIMSGELPPRAVFPDVIVNGGLMHKKNINIDQERAWALDAISKGANKQEVAKNFKARTGQNL
jgi:disulfide oxidoreductase YuzD